MPTYRIHFLEDGTHITRQPEVTERADDPEAAQRAHQFVDGKDIALWREGYLVAQFPKKSDA